MLPTVLKDCGDFPGAITIIGISAANKFFTENTKIIINAVIYICCFNTIVCFYGKNKKYIHYNVKYFYPWEWVCNI